MEAVKIGPDLRLHQSRLLWFLNRFLLSEEKKLCNLIKTRLQITANVITDEGIRMGSKALLNFPHRVVGVEEYFL